MNETTKQVLDWLYAEYKRKGRDFSFKSTTIKKDLGIPSCVASKILGRALKDGVSIHIVSKPRTSCFKWKTNFGEIK